MLSQCQLARRTQPGSECVRGSQQYGLSGDGGVLEQGKNRPGRKRSFLLDLNLLVS